MEISLAPNYLPLIYLPLHTCLVFRSHFGNKKKFRIAGINLVILIFFGWLILWGKDLFPDYCLVRFIVLWSPLIFFWFGYLWAGLTLTSIHPSDHFFDRPIALFEEKHLGQPSLHWGKNRSRFLTELFHFGYISYYLYALSLGIIFDSTGRFNDFQTMSFAINFGYVVSYLCFALIPVAGPRWFLVEDSRLKEQELKQPGYLFTRVTHKLLYGGLVHKGGAMPSSHSSTAFVFFFFVTHTWGWAPGLAALVLVIGMWIGAIYGRYHYLTDVAVGILLGGIGVVLAMIAV